MKIKTQLQNFKPQTRLLLSFMANAPSPLCYLFPSRKKNWGHHPEQTNFNTFHNIDFGQDQE